MEAITVIEFQL